MFFLLIGGGLRLKLLGTGHQRTCSRCHNTSTWQRMRRYRELTLFFIPLARWGRTEIEVCPVCAAEAPATAPARYHRFPPTAPRSALEFNVSEGPGHARCGRRAGARRRAIGAPPTPASADSSSGTLTAQLRAEAFYAAEPDSRSEEALKLVGSSAATVDLAEPARATDQS